MSDTQGDQQRMDEALAKMEAAGKQLGDALERFAEQLGVVLKWIPEIVRWKTPR